MEHLPAIDKHLAWRHRKAVKRLRSTLALALALHAAALLVPFSKPAPTAPPGTLSITLKPSALPERPPVPAPTPLPAERSSAQPEPEPAPTPGPAPPEPAVAEAETAPRPTLSAAMLFQLARELRWTEPQEPPPIPGEPRLPGLPANLARPLLPYTPTRFAAHMLPLKAEVLDRWQEAGGVHRVVIRAPDGETYCGRREPWDPLNPLFEPIMLFHSCGGGGRRKLPSAAPFGHEG